MGGGRPAAPIRSFALHHCITSATPVARHFAEQKRPDVFNLKEARGRYHLNLARLMRCPVCGVERHREVVRDRADTYAR
jgi:hypothetical protein